MSDEQRPMNENCEKCGARCCRYFCFEIEKPDTFEQFENVRWYLMHKNVSIHIDTEGDWYIRVDNRCNHLVQTPQGPRCDDYANRPNVCRRFSPEECDFTQGEYEVEELFNKPEELAAYARRMLGEIAWQEGLRQRDALPDAPPESP